MGLPGPGRDSPLCSLTGNFPRASKSAPRPHHTLFCSQGPFRVGCPFSPCAYPQDMRLSGALRGTPSNVPASTSSPCGSQVLCPGDISILIAASSGPEISEGRGVLLSASLFGRELATACFSEHPSLVLYPPEDLVMDGTGELVNWSSASRQWFVKSWDAFSWALWLPAT